VSLGLWPVAVEQGEIAALNALGGRRRYRGHVPVTALKVSGITVRSAGAAHATRPGEVTYTRADGAPGAYVKLVTAHDRLIGAVLVGTALDEEGDEADAIIEAVRRAAPLTTLGAAFKRGRWNRSATAQAA
jgi:NAD(P)H-nitrite reductase large subunit